MPVYTVYDFVSDASPDYSSTTLTLDPQQIMVITGEKDVQINSGFGQSEERIILSEDSRFWFKLQWQAMTEAEHSTLFDFYHDSSKGCGTGRSFFFDPPAQYDSHIYVVRFDTKWESFLRTYQNYGVATMLLRILGRQAE